MIGGPTLSLVTDHISREPANAYLPISSRSASRVGNKQQIIGTREQGLRLSAAYMMFRAVHHIGNAVQDNGTRIS